MKVIQLNGVGKSYFSREVLTDIQLDMEENRLTAVIGRNGVGKTTLLKMIAGYKKVSNGELFVFGESPFNSLRVSANSIFIDDALKFPEAMSLQEILNEAARFYPNWDDELANRLLQHFQLSTRVGHRQLSKGKKSTFNAIFGIAAHAPLTIFDEPTTGMDAAVRKDFYRALLKDYLNHPRTILLSSHHLEEIEHLVEDVLLIHDGRIRYYGPITELQEMFISVKGSPEKLSAYIENQRIVDRYTVGPFAEWIVENTFSEQEIQRMEADGLRISAVNANDAYIALTGQSKGGIDNVFTRDECQ